MAKINKYIFENDFDDGLLLSGESLYDKNRVKDIKKLENGLYVLLVKDENLHETEFLKPFTKKQKVTCDCSEFVKNGKCSHIVAGLFALRSRLQSEEENKINKRKQNIQKPKNNKLNTSTILENITEEELKNFVGAFSSKNPKFSTALKVTFARKIDLEDNYSKYKQLLDSIIKPVTTRDKSVSANEIKMLISVVKDLSEQFYDCLALEQFLEGFLIVENVINKVEYTKYHYEQAEKELNQYSKLFHSHIVSLLKADIAPELRKSIFEFLINLSKLSYYSYNDARLNAIFIIFNNYKNEYEDNDMLSSIVAEKLASSFTKWENKPVLFTLQQLLSYKEEKKAISISGNNAKFSIEIIDNLIKLDAIKEAELLVNNLIQKDTTNKNLYYKLLELLILKEDYKEFINQASSIFIKFKDFRIIDSIQKSMSESQKAKAFKLITKNLKESKESQFKAKYFLKIKDKASLIKLVIDEKDFRLIMSYDKYLINDYFEELNKTYLIATSQYLDTHIGTHSSVFITELSQHLHKIGGDKILKNINKLILENYSHRSHFISSVK
jgi:hypothetical protein